MTPEEIMKRTFSRSGRASWRMSNTFVLDVRKLRGKEDENMVAGETCGSLKKQGWLPLSKMATKMATKSKNYASRGTWVA